MDVRDWLATHWFGTLFLVDFALFLIAILLWRPGSRPLAMALGVFALVPLLALIGVALDGVNAERSSTRNAERWDDR